MIQDVLCCVFDHNQHEGAARWADLLSPHFDSVILDSGSTPACPHPAALHLENVYYSGLMNEAYRLLRERDYRWLMIVTSDIEIDAANAARLVAGMQDIVRTANVGLYQPSCALSLHGRALYQSVCHYTGRLRRVNFQEGWFHLVCREVLDAVLPVDVAVNRLGWGVDLALSHAARVGRMLVLVDDRVRVVHPRGSGYNRDAAKEQMRRWLAGLPGYTSPRHFRPLKDEIRYL
ncbi:MAG: hypothetical protein IJK55_09285 [Bacteroidales bacterium]|nr:hypothetical protein [Bacteroidales bacterium]